MRFKRSCSAHSDDSYAVYGEKNCAHLRDERHTYIRDVRAGVHTRIAHVTRIHAYARFLRTRGEPLRR